MHLSKLTLMTLTIGLVSLVLLLASPQTEAQLTQSLGWGSGGSPGKRSLYGVDCSWDAETLEDILNMIKVGFLPHRLTLI